MSETKPQLESALKTLFERESEFAKACTEDAEAEHAYKLKFAEEYLKATGTIDERKHTALIACSSEHLAHVKASAVRDFTKEKLRDVQLATSARQSILSAEAKGNFSYANSGTT